MNKRMWTLLGLTGLLAGCPRPAPVDPLESIEPQALTSPYMDPRVDSESVHRDVPPPAISGGTLAVGEHVILVADTDRARIVSIDRHAAGARPYAEVQLPPAAEPGRIVLDEQNMRGHAILRGTGEVYTFDALTPSIGERRRVCAAPRGLAHDAERDEIIVGCRGGELVTLPAETGAPTRTVMIDGGDIRDVVIDGGELYVSRFRAAELLHVDAGGTVMATSAPYEAFDSFSVDASGAEVRFRPSIAWRTIAVPGGGVAMVHQRASDGELNVANPNAYYTTSLCNGSIIQTAVTFFDGERAINAPNLPNASLTVDVAVSADRRQVAVVNAGNQSGQASVVVYGREQLEVPSYDPSGIAASCLYADSYDGAPEMPAVPNAVAAGFDPRGRLFVLQRNGAEGSGGAAVWEIANGATLRQIDLGGEDVFDTGHAIFHGNASRSTACASCHPEGGEDGRTWHFAGIGPRRTPAMHGEVTSTAPFHWDGDLPTLRALADTVFTSRMGGGRLSGGQVQMLGDWLDELPAPPARRESNDASAMRGAALFHGEAACATCHSGGMFTNNSNQDVGTGGALQVPSLVGVASRLPVMHDGCAITLRDRFRPDCGGGDRHGRTSHLSEAQIGDLIAFLETL